MNPSTRNISKLIIDDYKSMIDTNYLLFSSATRREREILIDEHYIDDKNI